MSHVDFKQKFTDNKDSSLIEKNLEVVILPLIIIGVVLSMSVLTGLFWVIIRIYRAESEIVLLNPPYCRTA